MFLAGSPLFDACHELRKARTDQPDVQERREERYRDQDVLVQRFVIHELPMQPGESANVGRVPIACPIVQAGSRHGNAISRATELSFACRAYLLANS